MERIKLRQQRDEFVKKARSILNRAESEDRGLTAVEQRDFDAAMRQVREYNVQIEEAESNRRLPSPITDPDLYAGARTVEDEGLARWARGEDPSRTFEVRLHRRDMSTVSAGGIVPEDFSTTLFSHLVASAQMLAANPTVHRRPDGRPYVVPFSSSAGTAVWVSEGGTIGGDDPEIGAGTLNAYKAARLIKVSRELLEDSGVDLAGYLARAAGESIGLLVGAAYVDGDGSGEPLGFLRSITAAGTVAAAGTITPQLLSALYHAVPQPYRSRGTWMASDGAVAEINDLVDTAGRPLVGTLADARGARIFGRPVLTDPAMSNAAGGTVLAFGDFSQYHLRAPESVIFERSDDFLWETDQVAFRAIYRTDGALLGDASAIRALARGTA